MQAVHRVIQDETLHRASGVHRPTARQLGQRNILVERLVGVLVAPGYPTDVAQCGIARDGAQPGRRGASGSPERRCGAVDLQQCVLRAGRRGRRTGRPPGSTSSSTARGAGRRAARTLPQQPAWWRRSSSASDSSGADGTVNAMVMVTNPPDSVSSPLPSTVPAVKSPPTALLLCPSL